MWEEYGKEAELIDAKYAHQTGNILIIIFALCGIALMMYMLGKSDGREDALKENVVNCATVKVVEDG